MSFVETEGLLFWIIVSPRWTSVVAVIPRTQSGQVMDDNYFYELQE